MISYVLMNFLTFLSSIANSQLYSNSNNTMMNINRGESNNNEIIIHNKINNKFIEEIQSTTKKNWHEINSKFNHLCSNSIHKLQSKNLPKNLFMIKKKIKIIFMKRNQLINFFN